MTTLADLAVMINSPIEAERELGYALLEHLRDLRIKKEAEGEQDETDKN